MEIMNHTQYEQDIHDYVWRYRYLLEYIKHITRYDMHDKYPADEEEDLSRLPRLPHSGAAKTPPMAKGLVSVLNFFSIF